MHRAYWYTIIFIIGFIGVSLMSFYLVTHPQEIAYERTPADFGLSPQQVSLTTTDDVYIAGWHFPSPQNPKQALLLLHGYPAQKADLLRIASDLHPEFSLLLIDLRSFGDSGGTMTTFGVHEQHDVRAAVDFLNDAGYEHIGVFGYSLGGALALQAATYDERVDAAASYGAYADLRTLAHDTYKHLLVFKYPLAELLNVWSRVFWGSWVFADPVTDAVARAQTPLFIGHAQNDDIIPFHHARQLTDAANPGQLTTFFPNIDYHNVLPLGLVHELTVFFSNAFANTRP